MSKLAIGVAILAVLAATPTLAQTATDPLSTTPSDGTTTAPSGTPPADLTTPGGGTTTTTSTTEGSSEIATPVNPSPLETNRLDVSAASSLRLQIGSSSASISNPDNFTATTTNVAQGLSFGAINAPATSANGSTTSTTPGLTSVPVTISSYPIRLGPHSSGSSSSTYPTPLDDLEQEGGMFQ